MNVSEIVLDGETFRFVKQSRRGDVVVYTSGSRFLRLGGREKIADMVALHQKFEAFGFPVAPFITSGTVPEGSYYIEKSFGKAHFSELFREDIKGYGVISDEQFQKFLSITETYARAQFRSRIDTKDTTSFEGLIDPKTLASELPEYSEQILYLYNDAIAHVSELPFVLTQGDFSSHNLFPAGVIDFEAAYYAPFGYDLVTNIFTITYFPEEGDFEYYRWYSFSNEQIALYYKKFDALYRELGLHDLSGYKKYFEFLRAVWNTTNNHRAPKIQQWRYEFFKKSYLL